MQIKNACQTHPQLQLKLQLLRRLEPRLQLRLQLQLQFLIEVQPLLQLPDAYQIDLFCFGDIA